MPTQNGSIKIKLMMNEDLNVRQWNIWDSRDNARCKVVRRWVDGLRSPLHALCLQELQTNVERVAFQLNIVFPMDILS